MYALKVHYTHIDNVKKSMRIFLQHVTEIDKHGKLLLQQEKVYTPKSVSGL
jgi:hypothetical protein